MSAHRPAYPVPLVFFPILLTLLLAPALVTAQELTAEEEAYRAIMMMRRTAEPAEVIAKCDEFVEKFPESRYISTIMQKVIPVVALLDPTSPRMLDYAHLIIAGERATPMAYYNAAWALYEARANLDTAAAWVELALAGLPPDAGIARRRENRAMILDTQAHLAVAAGDIEQAIRLQREAVDLNNESYRYKLTLSEFLQEVGRRDEAEACLIDAVLQEPTLRSVRAAFNEFAAGQVESEDIGEWQREAVRRGVERHLRTAGDEKGVRAGLANTLTDLEMLPELARALAEQAVEEDPDDPAALAALGAQLLKERRHDEAERYLVEARLLAPENHRARYEFDLLCQLRARSGQDWFEYRASAISAGIDRLLERAGDTQGLKRHLAESLEILGVVPDRAMQLAREWVEATGPEKGVEEFMTSRVVCAQIELNLGHAEEALSVLEPILHLASPRDFKLHTVRAEALRALNRPEEAIEAYARIANVVRIQAFMDPLQELWNETYGGERDLETYLAELETKAESWHPTGCYEVPEEWAGRVALAELFTGVNCPHCIGADIAYDHLREYYPESVLAILIYHLDQPVENRDSRSRMEYYNAEERLILGTPTSIINGTEVKLGGVPSSAVRSLFLYYSSQVEQGLLEAAPVELSLSGERSGHLLTVRSTIAISDPELFGNTDLRVRLVLAEKIVLYTGGNKLPEHHLVVRSMVGGPGGFPLDTSRTSTTHTVGVDLTVVEADQHAYLEEWVAQNFIGRKVEEVFDTSCLDIDETRLVLVAFVQDDSNHAILQAKVVELR